jgi:glycosyltransferase involved in cell wall biosynthesis
MGKINLLYIITKLELGGAQTQLLSLVRGLDREKFNIFLFTAQDGLLLQEALVLEGLKIKRSRFLDRAVNPLQDLLALFELYHFIKKNKIQIVHTHSSKAGILGRWAAALAGVKNILHTVHGWSFNDYQNVLTKKFYLLLEKITAEFSDKLIVVSYYDKQKGLNNHIARKDKYEIIRYGIDFGKFRSKDYSIREELGILPDDSVVGMVSCFKPQKSPQDFVLLAYLIKQTLPNTKFILIGDGILRRTIEDLIIKFGLENDLILTGWRRDIPKILSILDVFVLTSLWEGLPISVLEAMASSLPVVVTDTGGISEVISDDETGFLVAPGDVQKNSERVIRLLRDKDLRARIGQKAKESLGLSFRTENMTTNIQEIYKNLN